MSEIITGLVSSGVTLIGSYFMFRNSDKSNQLKYITEERGKWRATIRELSVSFMAGEVKNDGTIMIPDNAKLENIREQIAVRLNPQDKEDNLILCLMDRYIEQGSATERVKIGEKLSIAFASLLKHDWERVKKETKMGNTSSKVILLLFS